MYIRIRMYVYIRMYVCMYTYVCMYVCIHTYVCMYIPDAFRPRQVHKVAFADDATRYLLIGDRYMLYEEEDTCHMRRRIHAI